MKKIFPLLLFFLLTLPSLASEPRIEVSDIDFGVLGVGVSSTREMRICNTGSAELRFTEGPGGALIEWLKTSEFKITTAEIEKLRTAVLGLDACINIAVTFSSSTENDFRDSAQVFANTRNRKDWSIWTAQVRQPGARLKGYHWADRWVVPPLNQCTKNTTIGYPADVELSNEGNGVTVVESVRITGPDAAYFDLDMTDPRTSVNPGDQLVKGEDSKKQRVIFRPREERLYAARLALVTRDPLNGMRDTIDAPLDGTGIESHITIADTDFGRVEAGSTRTFGVIVSALPTRPTSITHISIAGVDAGQFRIESPNLPTPATPWVLPPGTTREIMVIAEPTRPGSASAELVLTGDFSRCDDSVGLLGIVLLSDVEDEDISSGNALLRVDRSGLVALRLARPGSVAVDIFTSAGERAVSSVAYLEAGERTIAFDRSALAHGVYYLRVSCGSWSAVRGFAVP